MQIFSPKSNHILAFSTIFELKMVIFWNEDVPWSLTFDSCPPPVLNVH